MVKQFTTLCHVAAQCSGATKGRGSNMTHPFLSKVLAWISEEKGEICAEQFPTEADGGGIIEADVQGSRVIFLFEPGGAGVMAFGKMHRGTHGDTALAAAEVFVHPEKAGVFKDFGIATPRSNN